MIVAATMNSLPSAKINIDEHFSSANAFASLSVSKHLSIA